MFVVTVEGQYYADGKKIRKYKYQCNLPKMEAALSVIKNKIEERKLMKLLPDFVACRTRAITDVQTESGEAAAPVTDDISLMTLDQLEELILQKDLPIKVAEATDIIELRKDVSDAIHNLELFLSTKKIREEKKAEENELEKLNPDLADEDEPPTMPGTGAAQQTNPLAGLD